MESHQHGCGRENDRHGDAILLLYADRRSAVGRRGWWVDRGPSISLQGSQAARSSNGRIPKSGKIWNSVSYLLPLVFSHPTLPLPFPPHHDKFTDHNSSPSGGLVENPQDATFYDWLLIDAKNAPYASFRFHYRSLKYMLQLNLIPQSESRLLLPRIDSSFSAVSVTPINENEMSVTTMTAADGFVFEEETVIAPVVIDAEIIDLGSDGAAAHTVAEDNA